MLEPCGEKKTANAGRERPAIVDVVLFGAGVMAKKHIATIATHPETRIAGIYDPKHTNFLSLDRSLEHLHTNDLDEFDARIRESQIAIIACDTQHHRMMAEIAITRGLHCLIEKPAAGNEYDCAKILRLSARYGTRVAVGYVTRIAQSSAPGNETTSASLDDAANTSRER